MIRKILRLQYSGTKVEGKLDFRVNNDNVAVRITSSYVENNLFLNISLTFSKPATFRLGPCYKIEILNAKDETVFFFIYVDKNSYGRWTVNIPSLCNISALKGQNPDLVSGNSDDPVTSPPHIKMALTFGTKEELLPLSSDISNLSSIPMLRSILNETVFDDPQIEAGAIAKLTELSLDYLRSVIKVENAANILQFAKKYNVESLKEVAVKFVADNFREVMDTSGWKEMPDNLSKELLSTIVLSLTPKKNEDAAEQD